MQPFLLPLALSVLLASAGLGNELPPTVTETRLLLDKVKQEIAQEEKAWAEETAREKEAEGRRKQRYLDFQGDKRKLETDLATLDQKIEGTVSRMDGLKAKQAEYEARFRNLLSVVEGETREARQAMNGTLPYRKEKRLEQLDLLAADIRKENIGAEEAFNRLLTNFYQMEARLASEAEVYSGDFEEPGRNADPIQVKYMRVGKQVLAFMSMDGHKLGLLRRDASGAYAWVREKDLDLATRQALKKAIATAEEKSVPGFVNLPLPLGSFFADESSASRPVTAEAPRTRPGMAGAAASRPRAEKASVSRPGK